ncbi:MAG: glycosyltransferase family 2 protein [Parvularculaceae bacterium]
MTQIFENDVAPHGGAATARAAAPCSPDDAGAASQPRLKAGLGVIIVNYRTPDLVAQCLASIAPELSALDARAVVVDNRSDDGSADRIAAFLSGESAGGATWTERVSLVRARRNSGFAGGNNFGRGFLDAPYYLLLNSDALARPGALAALIAAAERRPDAGAVGPRLEDPDGRAQQSRFRFKTPLTEFLAGARVRLLDRLFAFAAVAPPVDDAPTDAEWVSFACVLLRREAVDAVGPMDEGYFMYFEDADYCRQLRRGGWSVVYEPSARVVHLRGGSSPVKSLMREKKRPPAYFYASRTRYFRKSFGPLGPTLANLAWTAGRAVAHVRLLVGRPVPRACARQARDQWINWRAPLNDSRAPTTGGGEPS